MRRLELAAALLLAACVPEEGPLMRPGEDCMECHGRDGEESARTWTIAGTVYAAPGAEASAGVLGASIQVTDAKGWSFALRSNLAGNFYSAEPVAFPLRVCVERGGAVRCMEALVANGSCNTCHSVPPSDGAEGRVAAP